MSKLTPGVTFLLFAACAAGDDTGKATENGGTENGGTENGGTENGGTENGGTEENLAPTAPEVAITPPSPGADADLTMTILTPSTDPEGESITYRNAWTVDGSPRSDLTGDVVSASETSDGQVWSVSVIPNDGELDGPAGTASVTIGNLPPSAYVAHIDPTAPMPGDTLTLVIDTMPVDPEGDTLTTTIKWYEDGAYLASRDNATSIDGAYVDGGEVYRADLYVTDGFSAAVMSSTEVQVYNVPPEITQVRITPTDPEDSEDLEAVVDAEDVDTPNLDYTYVWYRDGVEATEVGNSDTVDNSFTSVNEVWELEVIVSDGHESVSARTDPAVIIPWEGYTRSFLYSVTFVPDGSGGYLSAEGSWALDYISYAGLYGTNDCDLSWAISATENNRCSGCDYSFSANLTLDAASVITYGCDTLALDATAQFTFTESTADFTSSISGIAWNSTSTTMSLRVTGEGESTSSGTTYTRKAYSADVTEDSAGNYVLDVYYYYTRQY